MAIHTGELVSLSEQQLVDCSWKYGNKGCDGGFKSEALTYIKDNRGVEAEETYPYTATDFEGCRFNASRVVARVSGYEKLAEDGNEAWMKALLYEAGPLAVSIKAPEGFRHYSSGVFYDKMCAVSGGNHAVVVVGYGTENGQDYWLVKNSWGWEWGLKGYIKMSRNRQNNCKIASSALVPLL